MESLPSAPLLEKRHLDGHCVSEDDCNYQRIFNEQQVMNVKAMWATWIVIAGILFFLGLWNIYRKSTRKSCKTAALVETESQSADEKTSGLHRGISSIQAKGRRLLYPQSIWGLFPRVTRLQGATVIFVTVYSILFSFIGIAYGEWVNPTTPPGRRIGFLEFVGDRTGCLAFAFVPLVFTLSARDNIFSLITGISYQHLNFLHKWIGRFIFILTWVHTILWSIELGIMYQPQPIKYTSTWKKRYWKWGVGACSLLTFLFLHSFRSVQKWTGYEFFRKSHEFIAVLFLGACWGHWPEMREWLIAGIAIVFFDRFVRYARIFAIQMNWTSSEIGAFGFHPHSATLRRFEDADGIVNLHLTVHNTTVPYTAGQHFFLTFPSLSSFESHPFTTANAPSLSKQPSKSTPFAQEYIIRVLSGQTHRLAALAPEVSTDYTIPVVLCGPYGNPASDLLDQSPAGKNFLFVSGGTGVSFTLPLMRTLLESEKSNKGRAMQFVWAVRRIENYAWFADEIKALLGSFPGRFQVKVFVTRDGKVGASEVGSSSASSSGEDEKKVEAGFEEIELKAAAKGMVPGVPSEVEVVYCGGGHPDMERDIVGAFKEACVGMEVRVLGSGPPQMGEVLRRSVAGINTGGVNAALYWDSREY